MLKFVIQKWQMEWIEKLEIIMIFGQEETI